MTTIMTFRRTPFTPYDPCNVDFDIPFPHIPEVDPEFECIECGDELVDAAAFAAHMDEHNAIALVNDEEPTYYEAIGIDDSDAWEDR